MATFATQDSSMKKFIFAFTGMLLTYAGLAQYYQKDIIEPIRFTSQWMLLKKNNIKSVTLSSYESNNQPSEGFSVEQKVMDNFGRVETYTKTLQNGSSQLTAWYNANGQLIKTEDTSEDFHSVSTYEYDQAGRISRIINTSTSAGQITTSEVHEWTYSAAGKPAKMLRIRNGNDTTFYTFIFDEKGNVAEEHGLRKEQQEPAFYYYYDDKNRLTDVVRYNLKAQRLLPTNVFSYDASGRIAGMLLVPEGSSDYQRWYYDYDERGLKVRERVYDKKQELLGKIEYKYQ
jgi:YD repeat-containing protein